MTNPTGSESQSGLCADNVCSRDKAKSHHQHFRCRCLSTTKKLDHIKDDTKAADADDDDDRSGRGGDCCLVRKECGRTQWRRVRGAAQDNKAQEAQCGAMLKALWWRQSGGGNGEACAARRSCFECAFWCIGVEFELEYAHSPTAIALFDPAFWYG